MYINESINLVLPVRADDQGVRIHAYHTPISRAVFEANYRLIAATKAQLSSKGIYYQMDTGPRIAAMVLRDEGKKDEAESGTDGASALLTEIKRLTTLLIPSATGWESVPVDTAIARQAIDAEEWGEALSALVFFTCHFALARKAERHDMAEAVSSILKASITALPPSDYLSSLPKSIPESPSAGVAVLSVPS